MMTVRSLTIVRGIFTFFGTAVTVSGNSHSAASGTVKRISWNVILIFDVRTLGHQHVINTYHAPNEPAKDRAAWMTARKEHVRRSNGVARLDFYSIRPCLHIVSVCNDEH